MTIERWVPCQTYSRQEEAILKSLRRTRKLFAFLRDHRHVLFEDELQAALESMYRDTGAGKEPVCPARMAMAVLMQGYLGVSDAEAVQLTMVDLRWQMVLDCLGSTKEAFSQGAFQEFRQRLIRHDMDRVLLEKTVPLCQRHLRQSHPDISVAMGGEWFPKRAQATPSSRSRRRPRRGRAQAT